MQWDMGLWGLASLGLISLGFGTLAALLVGDGLARRAWALLINTVMCVGVGLVTSEWFFGWATEEELQPNVDGLSRDEVLLSSLITTMVVVLVIRFLASRSGSRAGLGRDAPPPLTPTHRHA
jgi:hypothetical protein